jgi:hypothetical protein
MGYPPQGSALYQILGSGTLTTSSATVPADTGRTEGNDFFKGCILMPIAGACAFQPRPIGSFATGTGIFTLDEAFSAAPGLVDYVILDSDYPVQRLADIISDIAAIEAKLDNGTSGLVALKALIDAIQAKLDDGTSGLAALKVLIDAVGLIVIGINSEVVAIEGKLDDGTSGLAALKALIDAVETKLDDGTSGLAALEALIDAIELKVDKLAGEAPVEGSTTANWHTATGTSGETGEDLVTIGVAATRYKLHSLLLDVSTLTDGATIHVKLFEKINGNEKKVYDQEFTVPTGTVPPDTDGLWIVNGTVVIHDTLRVEVYSDTSESKAIGYTAILEAM